MKRTMVWGLIGNGFVRAISTNPTTWNDPTYRAMYSDYQVVRVANYS